MPTFPLFDLAMMVGTLALCPPYKFPIQFLKKLNSKHAFAPSPRNAPEPLMNLPPLEGVGNAGCPLHPRPRVHLVLVERTRVNEYPGITRRSRTQWF